MRCFWILFVTLVAIAQEPPSGDLERLKKAGSRGIRVHDPSTIVRDKNEFWLFYTGRGIPSLRSTNLVDWSPGPRVFTNAPPWVTNAVPNNRGGLDYWAPDIIRVDDRYLLYYSVSSFGRNTSALGLASNKTLDPGDRNYAWRDEGPVIQSFATNNFNAIDPAAILDADGKLWLSFGSFWDGIKLVELDRTTGKRASTNMYSLARNPMIEAPFIYRHADYYYLFVNWGRCCRGTNSTYEIRIGRSRIMTGPYVDKEGKSMADGGGSLILETDGPFIGPGHAGMIKDGDRYWLSLHFYNGAQRGQSMLATRPLVWDPDGWPQAPSE